jgi:RNA-directed DNA polymerase
VPLLISRYQVLDYRYVAAGGGVLRAVIMRSQLPITYDDIASAENLLSAWGEFVRGKRDKRDVQDFSFRLMDNIIQLRTDLVNLEYAHGPYEAFNITDPKPRNIHKASVRDRLLHHAIYRQLYPFFDRTFIAQSYSCRNAKGAHKAMDAFRAYAYEVSQNHRRTCWVLKCDIRKFFASVDQSVLLEVLQAYIPDQKILWLLGRVVESFNSGVSGRGLPLGNLTSQLLVNIYMNEFDQFAKHGLKAKRYLRYADDFTFLSADRDELVELIPRISAFLGERLKLELHPDKLFIKTFASGVDFLGWVHFPDHRVLRTVTKRRALVGFKRQPTPGTRASYLGLLTHGNARKLAQELTPAPAPEE